MIVIMFFQLQLVVFILFCYFPKNTPNPHAGAYWYYTPAYQYYVVGRSIGFAPTGTVNQDDTDNFYISNNQRVSRNLHDKQGGWRLGSITGLNTDTRYSEVILKYDKQNYINKDLLLFNSNKII